MSLIKLSTRRKFSKRVRKLQKANDKFVVKHVRKFGTIAGFLVTGGSPLGAWIGYRLTRSSGNPKIAKRNASKARRSRKKHIKKG